MAIVYSDAGCVFSELPSPSARGESLSQAPAEQPPLCSEAYVGRPPLSLLELALGAASAIYRAERLSRRAA